VALARALARNPRLILLDEPLTALDLPLRDPMRRELRLFLRSLEVPSLVVTHDRVDALTLGDRMAVLSGGHIRQVGPVHEVFSRPVDRAVAASAMPIGMPGWPEFACCTASMASVRMVLMHSSSIVPVIAWYPRPAPASLPEIWRYKLLVGKLRPKIAWILRVHSLMQSKIPFFA
jgi:ABC-type methionine transport system ATPase subunit